MGDGRIFLKASVMLPLTKIYGMSLIWAGSISLDSTFKEPRHVFMSFFLGGGRGWEVKRRVRVQAFSSDFVIGESNNGEG
jgi:hypothetical protein